MKFLFLASVLFLQPAYASALQIHKQVEIRFVFHKAQPFFVESEYGQCEGVVADFAYSYKQVPHNIPEYFPHIGTTNTLRTPCHGDDELYNHPGSLKFADLLNAQVKQTVATGIYELLVLADYTFNQSETASAVRMEETIKFQVPGVDEPVALENSAYIPKN